MTVHSDGGARDVTSHRKRQSGFPVIAIDKFWRKDLVERGASSRFVKAVDPVVHVPTTNRLGGVSGGPGGHTDQDVASVGEVVVQAEENRDPYLLVVLI